jgi:uncharacterized membrane protein
MPVSPLHLLLALLLLGIFVTFVQIGVLTIAFEKLGLSGNSAIALLITSLAGSVINLPVCTIKAEKPDINDVPAIYRGMLRQVMREFTGQTLIAVNVGGALVPTLFSFYLIRINALSLVHIVLGVVIVTTVCYSVSRPLPGLGIGLPIFVAPATAAIVAITINPELGAPLAYISGTLGVLIGADILRFNQIKKMGAPIASIGGAGTFDGIFITGIIAVLLT